MEETPTLFHGTIEATIFKATPYTPFPLFNCIGKNGKAAYVTIKIDNKKVAKTSKERNRVWNQTFHIQCAHPADSIITITLKTSNSMLGKYSIKAQQLLNEASIINGFFTLLTEQKKPNPKLKLKFILWFKPAKLEESLEKVLSNGEFQGLKDENFPQRSNCHVKLYHDAHHSPTFQPPFDPCGAPNNLWEDIYKAIEGAKHIVYIAAWSLKPKIVLVRDPHTKIQHARGMKLGDLLKKKADEGVAVRVMLWDDETSLALVKNKGVMNTHDEDALTYFNHTKVICKKCPRLHHKFPTLFADNQKTITVDIKVAKSVSDREIMSFVGGLDLCDGRYDTEQHSLFQTLIKESHCYDFYQPNIEGASLNKGGPRVPWHDAHACVTGEAAWDVLTNFEQRWAKQYDPSLLVPISTLVNLMPRRNSNTSIESNWKVQVHRSIDQASVGDICGNFTAERSIHEAYVEAIRHAERFIYIENQYFIGGCQWWKKDKDCGCTNLIPIEIALKVVSKIKAKERFAVYIVIPMWPEGVPESESVQDILHWTRETVTMMYRLIGEAIKQSGEIRHPRDYLNFFCLANREHKGKGEYLPLDFPHLETQYWHAQKSRRFMVYVHSKLMIVDDMYILLGSANVNQRSMDGKRDTEIAIGCFQSQDEVMKQMNLGDVHAYRMSLWYEHTNSFNELFLEPESLECVKRMCSIGDQMWETYSSEEIVDMEGVHLVTYPMRVTQEGYVKDLSNGVYFPDTNSLVKGKRSTLPTNVMAPSNDEIHEEILKVSNEEEDSIPRPRAKRNTDKPKHFENYVMPKCKKGGRE